MAADWKRAPLPEGHDEETLHSDGSNALHRTVIVAVAVGGVFVAQYYLRASRNDHHDDRSPGAEAAPAPTVTGPLHLVGPDVDLVVGGGGWRHRGESAGGQLYVPWGAAVAASLQVSRRDRSGDVSPAGLQAALADGWLPEHELDCEPSDVRGGQPAIHCNDDPAHVWAWPHGDELIVALYVYDPAHQPDYGEVERMIRSIAPR